MTNEEFLNRFGHFIDAPNGFKKLRELVLQLAVQGKLVEQDAKDEPVSILRDKIEVERDFLIKSGKGKKNKTHKKIESDEPPNPIPHSWDWVRLGEVAEANTGFAFKSTQYTSEGTFVLRVTNINPDGSLSKTDAKYISSESASDDYSKFVLHADDVLLVMVGGSLGKIGIVDDAVLPAVLNQNMWKIIRFGGIPRDFMTMVLRYINGSQINITNSTHGHLAQGEYLSKLIPLPPLAEQHRIVAKVDELMALCDQLEAEHKTRNETHSHLIRAAHHPLTEASDTTATQSAWHRIRDNFDNLYITKESVQVLRNSILLIAVQGKLVQQDLDDELTKDLLEKIDKEREQLVKDGKIRKQKELPKITDDEKPFKIPMGWEWVRIGRITEIKGGKRVSNGYKLLTKPTPYIYIRVSDMKKGSIDDSDLRFIDEEMHSKISQYIIQENDIYMTIVGATIGKCGLVPSKFDGMNLTENAARIVLYQMERFYLFKCLSSSFCQNQFFDKTKQVGVQKMALHRLSSTMIPLPPVAEQHRIVAKVDEMMALCDQLEAQINDKAAIANRYAESIVQQIAAA